MPVFSAGSKIKDIYFGNQKIIEAYFGSQLVYSSVPPLVTNGLQLHLDASNPASYSGSGTTWFDISGNNRNFTAGQTPSFATESGVTYFNTSGRSWNGPASNSFGINNSTGYTIFILYNHLSNQMSHGAFKFIGSVNSANRGIYSHLSWANIIYFDQGGCCDPNQRLTANQTSGTGWKIVALKSTVSTREIWINGVLVASTSVSAQNINLTSSAVQLGWDDTYGTSWNARLNGFIVYNRGLSSAEIQENYNILKSRVGL